MNQEIAGVAGARRSPIRGLAQIVRFNWPQYVVGISVVALVAALTAVLPMPAALRWALFAGTAAAGWWLLASLIVSYWVYDVSPLTRWQWLKSCLPPTSRPTCIMNIHSGFDDTTMQLREVFSSATVRAVDLYDPQRMSEPSIHRARRALPPLADTLAGAPENLPVANDSIDAVMLLFAAHELRQPADREALFRELRRALKPGGRVVLVEHARDAWNFLAFGPGFVHFFPQAEWLRLGLAANLRVIQRGCVTPFVRYLVSEK